MGGGITSHRDHKLQALSPETSKQACKQVLRAAELTFSKPNVKEPTEELTIDLSYQNAVMETAEYCHNVSSSCSEVPHPGIATVDSDSCKSNTVPRSESLASPGGPPLSKSCLRVDTADPDDLFYRMSTMSKLKTCCYGHVSTSYLPVADSYIDLRTVAENSTKLIHKSNHFSRLHPACYSHVSASYLPVPEPAQNYADFVTMDTADFPHQTSQMPKKRARDYIHVSTSYLPLPLTHSETDFTDNVQEKNLMSGLKSCIYNHIQTNYQKSCPDFEVEDAYRPWSAEECPLSL